jgi:hypothetical protein
MGENQRAAQCDPECSQMQRAWLEDNIHRRRWIITETQEGYTVDVHSADGVAPQTLKATRYAAAARLLQLLKLGPVAPQIGPESVCIGFIASEASPERSEGNPPSPSTENGQ